ncbi:17858_t:CDS:1, partial [Funneliformis geosporum]
VFLIVFLVVGIVIFRQLQAKKNKKTSSLKEIVIRPTKKHSASVIFLHGLGNNAENQRRICQPLTKNFPHIKFIIPQAPTISVSMNGGRRMPA